MIFSLCVMAIRADYRGSCGDNASFLYRTSDQTLLISGTGEIHSGGWKNVPRGGDSYISYADSIRYIIVEEGITSIGEGTFNLLYNVLKVDLPETVTNIGYGAFSQCYLMEEIHLPSSLKTICDNAFARCYNLSEIIIPITVDSIGITSFSDCASLTKMIVEEGNMRYDSREGCNAIIETESDNLIVGSNSSFIPSTVKRIGNFAFESRLLSSIRMIPSSLEEIGEYAFAKCINLSFIEIPESVNSIGDGAFVGCVELDTVKVYRREPLELKMWFYGKLVYNPSTFSRTPLNYLIVPYGCKESYQNTPIWKDFKNIIEETGTDTEQPQRSYIYNSPAYDISGRIITKQGVPGFYVVRGEKVIIK